MKKWSICKLAVILILLTKNKIQAQDIELIKTTHLKTYPSASALEFYKDRLYVTGDDATTILVLDEDHQVKDSIRIFQTTAKRISKSTKPDLEGSIIIQQEGKDYLLLFSSFSTKQRNKLLFLSLADKQHKTVTSNAGIFASGVKQVNIEGAALIKNVLVLGNRANNSSKKNLLLVSKFDLSGGLKNTIHRQITMILPQTKQVIGISGLTYVEERDLLLFTASTENTANAYTDGEIGASYIGYISSVSQKLKEDSITIDKLIDLTSFLPKGPPQKIESITVERERNRELIVHLAADNDNGESTLFKLKMKWNN